ncbi:MAG: HD domain-containing protein, partial [Spirochaetales bacterium]|nr:HD domain-containing protein [Spirochaetales bacterium]
ALPSSVKKIFKRVIPTGLDHGTVTVLFKEHSYEVTTYRIEGEYSDARHPDEVQFSSSIYADLERRDFTINAIAYDLIKRKIVDPHSGIDDIKRKIIRAIGNPAERFKEDCLRTLRACRFAAQLDFSIDPGTMTGLINAAPGILAVSWERIRDEIIKTIQSGNPVLGFEMMRQSGLLKLILPELSSCENVAQRGYHSFDVYYHSLYCMEGAPRENLTVRLAALFHDIGKPPTMTIKDGEARFYSHEKVSAEMAEKLLTRLKMPNKVIKDVSRLILHHMFNYDPSWADSAVRRLLSRVGIKHMGDLIELRRADQYGMGRKPVKSRELIELRTRISEILDKSHALSLKDLNINGKDLMETLGLPAGPKIGILLESLMEAVMDDPSMNERDKLLNLAKKLYETRIEFPSF